MCMFYIHTKHEENWWTLLISHPSIHPFVNKTFSRFQNGEFPNVNLKFRTPLSNHNKMEEYQMDPIGFCFRRVPLRVKTFSRFQNGKFQPVN